MDLKFCKRNLGDHRSEDLVDKPGGEMGEMSTIAEAGQRCNMESRSTHSGDDVSDKILQASAGSSNMWLRKERGHASQEYQASKDGNGRH